MSFPQEMGVPVNPLVGVDALNLSGGITDALNVVKSKLQSVASDDQLFATVLGEKANTLEIKAVREQWAKGVFEPLSAIQVISAADMNGADGAYASATQTIYLSDGLFSPGAEPVGSMLGAAGVLVEEAFHWLDDRVGTDTLGDEGELARNLVFGVQLSANELNRIGAEDDRGVIAINAQQIGVEMSSDYAGNTLSTARNITIGALATTFRDWVGSTDTNDYYRFTLSNTSNLSLRLNGLFANADVQLLDANGVLIQASTNSGTAAESITRQVNAGTYFIRVFPASGTNTNYSLNLSATNVLPPDYAGNTIRTARNITLGASTSTFRDWVGNGDSNDYYRFTLSNTSNFSLSLNGLSADADVQLLNSSGNFIQDSANTGTSAESISRRLNAGTYFIRVFQYSGSTSYNLNASATTILPPDYAGNTLSTARNITLGASTTTFQDWVGGTDTNDYYQFTLSDTSDFGLNLNGLSANADVQLLDANGVLIQASANSGTTAESITRQINAGTYFIRVFPASGANTNYNLNLSAVTNSVTPTDWYGQNLRDAGIASLTRSLAADGSLSRNDILSIFRNAQDGSLIDSNEQGDLRTIVSNSTRFVLTDSVRYLSEQVVNGISANMSASLFESNLVGRWFLGTVAPTAIFNDQSSGMTYNFTHTQVQGSLFGSSGQARIGDIDQGQFGDCAFLAALGATFSQQSDDSGNQSSALINSMIEDNGIDSVTGIQSYTMRFFANSVAQYVTVDNRLATYNGQIFGASRTNALWVPLVERAYAQWREWREGRPGYNLIGNGDNLANPLGYVTGRAPINYNINSVTFSQLQTALSSGRAVETARTSSSGNTAYIVNYHAYSVTNAYVNGRGEQRVVVRNPWGLDGLTASGNASDGFIDLSFSEFRASMNYGVTIA
jgi:hypothetical protein